MIFDFVTKGFGSVKDAFSGAFSSVKDVATSTWNSALKPIGQAGYNMVQKNLSRLDNLGNTAASSWEVSAMPQMVWGTCWPEIPTS